MEGVDGVEHEDEAGRSDDSDSDESDFEEVEASQEDIDLVAKLEADLQSNPNNYDSNVQAIFPMTEALWEAWLTDEAASSSTADVCILYEKAVEDYLSVNLWTQYLRYLRKHDADVQQHSPAGVQKYKDVSERALTAAGLHMAEGGRIWEAYRGYLQESVGNGAPSPEEVQRVRELFHRQLQVPLLGHEATLEAHAAWEAGLPEGLHAELPGTVRQGYERAAAAAALRAASEAAIGPGRAADADLLAAYLAYIKLEEVQGDPARVIVLYERMLAAFPVTHHLWLQYGRFLEARLKAPAAARRAYARAVRNCPWVGELWGRALRALEADCAPSEQAAELYVRALAAGMQTPEDYLAVILPRLDGLRRQGPGAMVALRAAFQEATALMGDYFPQYNDRALHLPAYWAECELRIAQDLTAARAVWEAALKRPVGRYADAWAAYIALEFGAGQMTEARALYRRACTRRMEEGGQAALCQAWLRFEREHGDLASLAQAELKTEPVLTAAAAAAAVAADAETAATAQAAAKARKLSKAEMRQLRQERDPNFKQPAAFQATLGQQEAGSPAAAAEASSSRALKRKEDVQEPDSTKRQKVEATSDIAMEDAAPSDNGADQAIRPEAPQEAVEAKSRPDAAAEKMGPPPPRITQPGDSGGGEAGSSGRGGGGSGGREAGGIGTSAGAGAGPRPVFTDERTVFVKGLRDAVGEADLDTLFGPCGALRGVRIGRDAQTGRHRGFAYVTFGTEEALQQALALSGTDLHGTKIVVAISRPPGGGGRGGRGGAPRGGRGRAPGPGRDGSGGSRRPGGGRGQGGGQGGRGRGADVVHEAPPGHHRMHLDLDGPQGAARPSAPSPFVPRAVIKAKDAADAAPKSNADFRNMFLKK